MTVPHPAVAVVIPARDEEASIGAGVRSVLAALDRAGGSAGAVVVVAHRCSDRTAEAAAEALGHRGRVLLDDDSSCVAGARSRGAAAALSRSPAPPEATWLLSTDADSTVPPDWVTAVLAHARAGAAAVAGLVSVRHDPATPAEARRSYAEIVRAGLRPGGHRHVHGANLAVRADAYLAVGGWPGPAPGEDRALVDALRRDGWPVVAATDVVVSTSGRRRPRAAGGLGSLIDELSRLAAPARQAEAVGDPA